MSAKHPSDLHINSGLASGRKWSVAPIKDAPVAWSIEADKGYIQGPLDLEFLRGKKLSLVLTKGQQALLVHNGQLRAVYLDGVHYLEIGTGRRQIDPSCRLIFLAMDKPLRLSWSRSAPLCWGPQAQQTLIGSCDLRIEWPSRFFGTFLQGVPAPDPDFTVRLIEQMVRGLFESILQTVAETEAAPGDTEIQAHLMRLTPQDLNDELNANGLNCTHLAVYTSAPPLEDDQTTEKTIDPAAVH